MCKKIIACIISIFILVLCSIGAFAINKETTFIAPKMYDYGQKLSQGQIDFFNERSNALKEKYNLDIIAMSISSDNDDIFYGYKMYSQIAQSSEKENGVLLYIEEDGTCNMESFGPASNIFTNAVIENIKKDIKDELDRGGYYNAYDKFLNCCYNLCSENYIENKTTTDMKHEKLITDTNTPENNGLNIKNETEKMPQIVKIGIVVSVVVGFVIAFVICGIFKKVENKSLAVKDDNILNEKFELLKDNKELIKNTISKKK